MNSLKERVKNEETPKQKAKENRKVTGEKIVTKLDVRQKPVPENVYYLISPAKFSAVYRNGT